MAYHFADVGETDVILLKKSQLTHGCPWYAAGLVGQLQANEI